MLEGDAEAPIEAGHAGRAGPAEHAAESWPSRQHHLHAARISGPRAPQWAVISCGLHNRYGHPRQEVLEELQSAHVRTFRTDINGATCFLLDGKSVTPDLQCGWRQGP